MKFTRDWLFDHLETDRSLEEILEILPMLGLEVESFVDRSVALSAFTIAKVVSAEQHPDADKLRVCMVDTGADTGLVQVVCGAPNARAGMKGVFAPVGAYVPGIDLTLKVGEIRGQQSNGMLCSEREMELSDEHDGIIDLAEDAPVGMSFAAFAGLDDPIIEIAITPNRADCLGVRGVARDLSAAGYGTLKDVDFSAHEGSFDSPINWKIENAEAFCPRVTGTSFRGLKNGASPEWMARRLAAVGQRPISALVDITNYVMIDLGRPLHAYDSDKIAGDTLTIRPAKDGETMVALNEKEYALDTSMFIIADEHGADDLAGIMGGERTGVSDETTNMFLEVAIFDPISVAKTARKLNINSDARYRFERGLDVTSPDWVQGHVARLVTATCGGEASHVVGAGAGAIWERDITLAADKVKNLTGMDVPVDEQVKILETLGFTVAAIGDGKAGDGWRVTPPSWRGDIVGAADLVEEIARIHGYDNLVMEHLPREHVVAQPSLSPLQARQFRARRALASRGLMEAVTFSFLSETHAQAFEGGAAALKLVNPISAELSVMRPSILPNLLSAAARNQDRGEGDVAMFEVGPVFLGDDPDQQRIACSGIRHGSTTPREWHGSARIVDVFDAKADAEAALASLGVKAGGIQTTNEAHGYFHPGRSGSLIQGRTKLASFGELHPKIVELFGLRNRAVGFEIHIDDVPMPKSKGPARALLSMSVFQPVSRDFAFIVDEALPAGDLLKAVKSGAGALTDEIFVFDVYQGDNIESGKKSVGVTVTLSPMKATLTDQEIEKICEFIVALAAKNCGAQLR